MRRRHLLRRVSIALVAAAALLGCLSTTARADGDPASDYLYTQWAFVPAEMSAAQQAGLKETVHAARVAGYPIKVAVIGSSYDLGSITPLWRKPATYARFLGTELSFRYHGVLLIAMPNGFGVYHDKRSTAVETKTLQSIHIAPGSAGLVSAAVSAVKRLAAAAGHPIRVSPAASLPTPSGSRGVDVSEVIALAIGSLMILAAWIFSLRLRPPQRVAAMRPLRAVAARFAWLRVGASVPPKAVGLLILSFAIGGAMIAVAFAHLSPRTASSPPPLPPTSGLSGFTWPAHSRPAPDFTLRDQAGRPVSLRASRGNVTILAFLDPVCRNLCPLEAAVLGKVERRFAASTRPPIVAVSVNPWGNSAPTLRRDIREWRVGSDYRWAVGSRAELARIWHAFHIGVQFKTVKVAGTTVHEVSHDEQIYLIDKNGYERVLDPWPFTAAAVVRNIRTLQGEAA
jgi:cytochrome oxidase Cu insertion factor (SCO1/SenC/PrrC family)